MSSTLATQSALELGVNFTKPPLLAAPAAGSELNPIRSADQFCLWARQGAFRITSRRVIVQPRPMPTAKVGRLDPHDSTPLPARPDGQHRLCHNERGKPPPQRVSFWRL